MLQIFF